MRHMRAVIGARVGEVWGNFGKFSRKFRKY
jgi:hypothetical protein